MSNKPKIKVTKNGPYLVSGNVPLKRENSIPNEGGIPERWKDSGEIKTEENFALCRCGKSKNKPFCDGNHTKANFDGTEVADNKKFDEQAEIYDGPELVLKDAESFCSISRFCELGESVWNLVEDSDNPEAKESAVRESCNCPSGRLVVYNKKTGEKIEQISSHRLVLLRILEQKLADQFGSRAASRLSQQMAINMKIETE